MEILNISLSNFRNFASKKLVFDKHLTVIIGPNGSGKSNILESVSLLCGVRPLHIESDLDLVKFGKSEARIEGRVKSLESEVKLTINFQVVDELHIKKSYLIDDLRKRLVDFASYLAIVVFHPQDLDLVEGAPNLRRHHLDSFLSSLDRDYWRNISAYNKIVVRRNKVLQRIFEGKAKPLELGFWDERLLEHGANVSKKRQEFFEFLNFVELMGLGGRAPSLGHSLGRDQKSVRDLYEANNSQNSVSALSRTTSPRTHEKSLSNFSWELKQSLVTEEKLLKNRERDIAARVTLSGPHRDDFRFMFEGRRPGLRRGAVSDSERMASGPEGRDLAYFGSRGQQRMAVLALKLAELEYFRVKRGARPILALDDIFSELDWEHRDAVLSVVGNQQTIITAAEKESVPNKLLNKAKVLEL